jgi:thiol-disulfide isomerase/thioredoxin
MIRTLNLVALGMLLLVSRSFGQGIHFYEGKWDSLHAEAKRQHKAIFVDCYTSWCGPCKMLASRTFPQKSVGDFYNEHFICYSMDMEKGEGPAIAQFFKVKFYPTMLYMSEDGALMHRSAGYLPPDRLIEQGRMALDPRNCLAGRIERFKAGERDTTFLIELAILIRNIDDQIQDDALSAYWIQVPDAEKTSATNWMRFKELDNSVNSPQFKYVASHKESFIARFGEQEYYQTIYQKAAYSMQHAAETQDENLMKNAKAVLDSSHQDDIMKFASWAELIFYKSNADYKKFHALAPAYADKYAKNSAEDLNNLAIEAATTGDKILIKDAEKWSEQSIKIKKSYANMDIYAKILFKLDKKKEAEKAALEAIDLAQKEGADSKGTRELLEKIKGK